jgi:hypothetical protein
MAAIHYVSLQMHAALNHKAGRGIFKIFSFLRRLIIRKPVYIKIFINGGKTLRAMSLMILSIQRQGQRGHKRREICGVAIKTVFDISVNTTVLESASCSVGHSGACGR